MWRAPEAVMRQYGRAPLSQGTFYAVRPYDSWEVKDAISDQNSSKSLLGSPLVSLSHMESAGSYEEAVWTSPTLTGYVLHSATI